MLNPLHANTSNLGDVSRKPTVCVILGQTASGKSRLCIELARRLGGEIVSMDALKVYRGMDIGTAKTPEAERAGVVHHLVDLVEPHEPFSVALYMERLEPILRDILARGNMPIVDCGTPLYLKAFVSGLIDGPQPDENLRAELEAKDSTWLHDELVRRDPAAAKRLHVNDRKRVIRALEFEMLTGEPISQKQTTFDKRREDYRLLLTGPLWSEEALKARISQRVDTMVKAGLVDEVRRIQSGKGFSQTAAQAIGYRQVLDSLEGLMTLEEAIAEVKRKTWQLARKQFMWFKRYPDVKWLQTSSDEELHRGAVFLAGEMKALLREGGQSAPRELTTEPRSSELGNLQG